MEFGLSSLNRKKININSGNKIVFTLMGFGGCNSYLAYELTQIASLSSKNIDILMIDEDEVTESDILKCKYLHSDINKKRAEVTARRCSASFNMDIEVFSNKIKDETDIIGFFDGRMGYLPVIICNNLKENEIIYLKKAVDKMSDIVVIIAEEYENTGNVTITYKENGLYLTDNHLAKYTEKPLPKSNSSKVVNLELSKNIFLFADEIISENPISIEEVVFDVKSRKTASRYIGERSINLEKQNSENAIKVEISDNILMIVIGVGGTGGSLAYELAHLASVSNKNIKLVFIDKDIVEAKNLVRQRFIMQDLNRYKSDVIAKRCKEAYGVNIVSMSEYIACEEDIYSILQAHPDYTPIILGCSDSLKLRYLICQTIKNAKNYFGKNKDIVYIDAGNSVNAGQIIFTYIKDGKYITPDQFEIFPQDLEDIDNEKLVTQMSCAELMVSSPQTKSANLAAATGIYSYVHDIIYENNIETHLTQFNNKNRRIESKFIKK